MEPSSTSSHQLDPARLPDPSLQRQSISSLFNKLRLSPSSPLSDSISLSLNSASVPAADQATRELCRLVSASIVPPSTALLELQSALDGCSSSGGARLGLACVFVKGIGFVVRFLFRTDSSWGRSGFDPVEFHPFVKVLLCGEHVEMELIRQVSLFTVHNKIAGMKAVARFLKPFLMFSVLRKSSLAFARDLISSVASIACSLKEEALLSLLVGCLKYFPWENEKELKLLLNSAQCTVDAYVVILRQHDNQDVVPTAQTCCVELLDTLMLLCYVQNKPSFGVNETILQLVKRLLSVQRELNLNLLPEFYSVFVSISYVLSKAELEHEQLAALKLLLFLTEWRFQSELNKAGPACLLREELLCIFPVVSLLTSPSYSVKSMASHFLSKVNGLVLDLVSSPPSGENACSNWTIGPHSSALLRLLHHLMFEGQSTSTNCFYIELITRDCGLGPPGISQKEKCWTLLLREYLSFCQQKSTPNVIQPGISSLLGSVAALLTTHATLGPSAVETLAELGAIDPKLAMPMLLIVLFYIRIFSSNANDTPEMVLRLMESLAQFASHNFMVPVVVQTILPMLNSEAKPMLYATAVRVLCKIWITTDRVFANLQKVLDVEEYSGFLPEDDIAISIAASVRDVCKNNPDRGVDLILSVSSCIESRNNIVQALGLEGLAYLCEADVVDFYTAWVVISKHLLDYSLDPVVAYGLAKLLKWGAMDAEAYPDASKNAVQILWDIATKRNCHSDSFSWIKARVAAFHSLSHYKILDVQEAIPNFKRKNFECFISESNPNVSNAMEDLEVEIIKFEHITRKRGRKDIRSTVSKAEKLLHVFPEVVFTGDKRGHCELPGAALICCDFTSKDEPNPGIIKDLRRVHAAYETALLKLAESLHVPRNLAVAPLAMQSWKVFLGHWIGAVVNFTNGKNISSDLSDKSRKAAKDIFKVLCKVAVESVPRIAVNVALAVGALCLVLPESEHFVVSDASDFLFKWLYEYGHEHKQWSAAISLGLITSCFHPTDKNKYKVINGLLEVIRTSESNLVRGACGSGLGYASKCLFRGVQDNITSFKSEETKLLETIITTLCAIISKQYPSTVSSFQSLLTEAFPNAPKLVLDACDISDEDPWGVAGLVLGLGFSTFALYRAEAYKAVIRMKDLLVSWVANALFNEITELPLCIGSCLALPMVVSFCHRVELSGDDDLDSLLNHYNLLISELIRMKKSAGIYKDLIMAASMGAGSFISSIANDGVYSIRLDVLKDLLLTIRNVYTKPYSPLVHLGGLIGIVNAFGASAGDLNRSSNSAQSISFRANASNCSKELTSLVRGPLLLNPACESLCTSTIQEIFLLAKDPQDPQRKHYAAWALSFLRNQWLSRDLSDKDSSSNQNLSEETLLWDLSSWLRDLDSSQTETLPKKETVATALRCLTQAPRLPPFDWGSIVRRYMRYEGPGSLTSTHSLREECLKFSLVHASHISTLLHFLDDLTDLPRFVQLDSHLQSLLLENLPHLLSLFSDSRLEKLFGDLMQLFSLESIVLRRSLWKGLSNCFRENSDKLEDSSFLHLRKCIEGLLSYLPGFNGESQREETLEHEWSDAIKCLSLAPQSWLIDLLKVTPIGSSCTEHFDLGKKIMIIAKLVNCGSLPVSQLGMMKAYILNARSEGFWWNVLLEVTAALSISGNAVKRQWLLDALEISCVTEYPLTALLFVGLLCGFSCVYMPLLIVDPKSVLADLPLTLPSLLSDPNWASVRSSVAESLWSSANRTRIRAENSFGLGLVGSAEIKDTDNEMGFLLTRVMHETCVALREYLPFDKQLKLANSEVL